MCVFVVGNVSAAAITLDKMEWAALADLTAATGGSYNVSAKSNSKFDFNNVTVTYENQDLTATKGKATISTKIKTPSITWKNDDEVSSQKYTYSINGDDEQDISALGSDEITMTTEITLAKLEEIAKAGGTTLDEVYTIAINLYDDDGDTDEILATATFKVNVKVDITDLVFKVDTAQKWNNAIYELTKATPVPATPTEENKTTEENKKDDVPKTEEVIYWCFGIRRRQRKRSRQNYN